MSARDRALLLLIAGLVLCLLVALGGVIYLAGANPARAIPDVLVALPTGILTFLGGLMVSRPGDDASGPAL